ncbi:MAG: hypothetical protein RIR91_344 [Verrucomicrobiota bacterium]|jgi:hypothetical protein
MIITKYGRESFYHIEKIDRSQMTGPLPRKLIVTKTNGTEFTVTQWDKDFWEVAGGFFGSQPMEVNGWLDGLRVLDNL